MRVVKPGVVPFDLYGTCSRCKCEVEGLLSDPEVKVTDEWNDYWREKERVVSCTCPTEGCGETIYLKERSRR